MEKQSKCIHLNMEFQELILAISSINDELREQSIRVVNKSLTIHSWCFGFYIVEFEQDGKDRAEYGKALLSRIAIAIKMLSILNTDEKRTSKILAILPFLSGDSYSYCFQ